MSAFVLRNEKKMLNLQFPGDVVLKNLQLKQSALKELDLPVQTVYGQLGKCTPNWLTRKIFS